MLFETHAVFCVFTIGKRRRLSDHQQRILRHRNVKNVRLKPIDLLYQKDIACQFLKVVALPLELERYF